MKYIVCFILLFSSHLAHARSVYITDSKEFALRAGESSSTKVLQMIGAGTQLTVLAENNANGYSQVKTETGLVGFVLTRYVLQAENEQLKTMLAELKQNHSGAASTNTELIKERDQLSNDLNALRQTASNAIQLQSQRNDLQERVVLAERELQQLKREKQALEDSTNQDWFLYGGALSFIGIFFGLLIPRIKWQRKHSSNWDTF
ncbi:MAG: TIGR04211 family SH3 domain-containing protein [Methylococcaceae bacterium]|nr:TIGR04211 family SH3 domain-containing protein [Methylococcaceae bacterium]